MQQPCKPTAVSQDESEYAGDWQVAFTRVLCISEVFTSNLRKTRPVVSQEVGLIELASLGD